MGKTTTRKNNTKKATKALHVMTVPQLRKAFEQIDVDTKKILSKHPINDESIKEFQKSWKQVFHKNIDTISAKSYLELQTKIVKKGGSRSRKTRKSGQSGGVSPLDYTLRPGIDGTHGNYLPYVSSGLSFYNNINQIAMDQDCGKIDITPTIDASMGSNEVMKGGNARLIGATVPPSVLQDVQDYYLGKSLGDSSSVLNTKYKGV
jgi:hypothetical protein